LFWRWGKKGQEVERKVGLFWQERKGEWGKRPGQAQLRVFGAASCWKEGRAYLEYFKWVVVVFWRESEVEAVVSQVRSQVAEDATTTSLEWRQAEGLIRSKEMKSVRKTERVVEVEDDGEGKRSSWWREGEYL
jgi:hypothetical protein